MKKILALIICSVHLFSLNIVLNSAKENDSIYAILHIEDSEPIYCEKIVKQGVVYLCKFNKIVKTPLKPKIMKLVDIDFLEKKKEFYLRISPKVKSKIIPINLELYSTNEVGFEGKIKKSKHWSILLYEKEPFAKKNINDGINFPILYPKNERPFVGALDLNGAPISYVQSKDITLFLDLKKSYDNKKYSNVIRDSLEAIKRYPKTIFKSEFLLYRLRALDKGLETDDNLITKNYDYNSVVNEGRAWIKAFPSDNNIPEVLMLIAKAYIKLGFKADANYFLDILISEHKDSPFTKQAILIFADSLYNSREKDKAIKLYKDVLYSAKDLDIAASAAIRLSEKELSRNKKQSAKEYLLKVLDANKEYLLKDREKSYNLAKKLAEKKLYGVAAKVVDVLLTGVKKRDEQAQELLRDSGIWHAKANDVQLAYEKLQKYLNEYKNGEYKEEVQTALDELFFELNETNETKLANYYDTLIKKYNNKIGDRAVIEKAKLLLSQKRYSDVLKMAESIKYATQDLNSSKIPTIVKEAAINLAKLDLQKDRCIEAINYIEKYKVEFDKLDNFKLFECFVRAGRYKNAKEISLKHIKDKNLKKRLEWLENYLLSEYKLGNFSNVVEIGKDLEKLSKILKIKPKKESLKYLFFSLMRQDNAGRAIEVAKEIEKNYKKSLENCDIFMDIVRYASDKRDDLLLIEYAKKIENLQNEFKSYVYTPYVEFSLIEAYKRLNRVKDAYESAKKLIDRELSNEDKTRAYYYAAEAALKLKKQDEAKRFFEKCIEIDSKSSWKGICEQSLKLF